MPAALSERRNSAIVAAAINQSGAKTAKDMGSIMANLETAIAGESWHGRGYN